MTDSTREFVSGIENFLKLKEKTEERKKYLYEEYKQVIEREIGGSDYEILDLFKMNEKVGDFLLELIWIAIDQDEDTFYCKIGSKINKEIQNLMESGEVGDIASYADVEQVKLSLQSYSLKLELDNLLGLKLGEPEREKLLYLFKCLGEKIDKVLLDKPRDKALQRQLRLIKDF